jgi:hypothetical protein
MIAPSDRFNEASIEEKKKRRSNNDIHNPNGTGEKGDRVPPGKDVRRPSTEGKVKGTVRQGESRQGRSGMAKDLEPRNKAQPTQGVQAGIKVVTAPESISSGYSLKPEPRISSAALVAARHSPKARQEAKKPSRDRSMRPYLDQFKIASPVRGQEGGSSRKTLGSTPEAMGKFLELSLTGPSQISCVSSEVIHGQNPPETMGKFSSTQVTDPHKIRQGDSQYQLRISTPEAMGKFVEPSLTGSSQISCVSSEVLHGQDPPEAMGKCSSTQVTDPHKIRQGNSQDQLCISTPEAMGKSMMQETPHNNEYSELFKNLCEGDDFAMDVMTMGGSAARAVEIPTTIPVLEFFLMNAHCVASLQDAMVIILQRSQVQSFLAADEWVTFMRRYKA